MGPSSESWFLSSSTWVFVLREDGILTSHRITDGAFQKYICSRDSEKMKSLGWIKNLCIFKISVGDSGLRGKF